jgi:hypothetical protein
MLLLLLAPESMAQRAVVQDLEEPFAWPGQSDSNSPAYWWQGEFRMFQSNSLPYLYRGTSQFDTQPGPEVLLHFDGHRPIWIESVFPDEGGTLYGWYHHEEVVCGGALSVPKIGAVVSYDGGESFHDLGIVVESGEAPDCAMENGYFAGGHGDPSILVDWAREYVYFYFGNYSGGVESQGVAVARLAFGDLASPAGRVWKYYEGEWKEPGLGGRVSPLLPATVSWASPDTDAFWGPALHWNTHLQQYVMLLNRSCCEPRFPQEGIYVSFNPDLGNPGGWSVPVKIVDKGLWYPQVMGLDAGETDRVAGRRARFYGMGVAYSEILFLREGEEEDDGDGEEPPPTEEPGSARGRRGRR